MVLLGHIFSFAAGTVSPKSWKTKLPMQADVRVPPRLLSTEEGLFKSLFMAKK